VPRRSRILATSNDAHHLPISLIGNDNPNRLFLRQSGCDCTYLGRFLYFDELACFDVVDVAIDRDGFRDERMVADSFDVVDNGLLLIRDGKDFDELRRAVAWTLTNILEALRSQSGGW